MSPISSVNPLISPQIAVPSAAPAAPSNAFGDLLSQSINHVEQTGAQSQQAIQQFLNGETDDVHKAALAAQRAELSSELFLQVRNKVVQAYQEIMRMQM